MKAILSIAVFLFSVESARTQNTNLEYDQAIKVYNLATYENYSKHTGFINENSVRQNTSSLQLFHPAVAYQWKTKSSNFHEVELTNFTLNRSEVKTELVNNNTGAVSMSGSESTITSTYLSARYEYILTLRKQKETKLSPSIGIGVLPYFRNTNYEPGASSMFQTTEYISGIRTFITPRLSYYLSSKVFLDLNIPFCFSDVHFLLDKRYDPSLQLAQRNVASLNFSLFPKVLSARFGVGFKI